MRRLFLTALSVIFLTACADDGADIAAKPELLRLSPEEASPGAEVTVTGRNLGKEPGVVLVGDVEAASSQWSTTSATFVVPELSPAKVPVTLRVGGQTSNALELVVLRSNEPPMLTSATLGEGPFNADHDLTVELGEATDADGDPVTFRYEWTVNDAPYAEATTATLARTAFQRGDRVGCTVTPNDGREDGEPVSTQTVQIENAPPRPPAISFDLDSVGAGDAIGISVELVDADGDELTAAYQWYVNGIAVDGATDDTLAPGVYVRGDEITVAVTVSDGMNETVVTSAPVVIGNTAPAVTELVFTAPTPSKDTGVTAQLASDDLDGDDITVSYMWSVNGVVVPEQTGTLLAPSAYAKGDTVIVTVTLDDGMGGVTSVSSAPITVANSLPVLTAATIGSGPYYTDSLITATPGASSDADGDDVSFTYRWFVNGTVVDGQTAATLSGDHFSKGQTVRAEVTPHDDQAAGSPVLSNEITVANSLPVLASADIGSGPYFTDNVITVTPGTADDADNDPLTFTYRWLVDGVVVDGETAATLSGTHFAKGQSVQAEVTPHDDEGAGAPALSNETTIQNALPALTAVDLGTVLYFTGDTLTATPGAASDADGDDITFTWRWFVNGAVVDGQTSATLNAAYFSKGQAVRAEATPHDDQGAGEPVPSNVVTIQNSLPVLPSADLGTDPYFTDDVIAVSLGDATDADGDTITFTYRWFVNGAIVAGETSAALSGVHFAKGQSVRAEITPHDDEGAGERVFTDAVVIENTQPALFSAALADEPYFTDSPMSPTLGPTVDADNDPLTFTYRWFVNDVEVAGQTTDTLASAHFGKGQTVRVEVTPHDDEVAGEPVSTNEVTILNSLPLVAAADIGVGPWFTGDTIAMTLGTVSDADSDTVSLSYRWLVDGEPVVGQTSTSLSGTFFDKGQIVQAEVTPHDGEAAGVAVLSNEITVQNALPVLASADIGSGPYYTGDDITVTPGTADDDDGDAVSFTWRWLVNGEPVAGQTSATLSGAHFTKGQTVRAEVTPHDGEAAGSPVLSNEITVVNSVPLLASADIGTGPYHTDDTISVSPGVASDEDEDDVTYTYRWFVDGSIVDGQTGASLTGAHFAKSQTVRAEVTPHDNEAAGDPVLSNEIVIENSLPVVASADIGRRPVRTDGSITVTLGAVTDADGDPVTLAYRWFVDGMEVVGQTSDTLSGAHFAKDQTVHAEVTPSDGAGAGAPVLSNAVTILNSAPVLNTVDIGSGPYRSNDSITVASLDADDADNDSLTYTYQWYVNGVPVVGETTALLAGTAFERGDEVYVQVVAFDGEEEGLPVDSNIVTIANTPPTFASVSLGSGPFYRASVITALSFGWNDEDGDSEGYRYAWYVDGLVVGGVSGDTIDGSLHFATGVTVAALVTADDGIDTGTAVWSPRIDILNTPPVLAGASIAAGPYFTDDAVTVVAGAVTDEEGDATVIEYRWFVDGLVVDGQTGDSLDGEFFAAGQTVAAEVTPRDMHATGTPVWSNVITIENTPPTLASAELGAGPYYKGDTISVLLGASADLDGDDITFTYRWLVGGIEVEGQVGASLSGAYLSKGQAVRVEVTPHDGTAAGTPVLSAAVTIQNSPPATPVAVIEPERLKNSPGIWVKPETTDPDGDSVTHTYTWFKDGVPQAYAADATFVPAADYAFAEKWKVEVTTSDGFAEAATTFAEVEIIFEKAVEVAAGGRHACLLTSEGVVKCWGTNEYYQLTIPWEGPRASLVPVDVRGLPTDIVSISAGVEHTCALTSTGGVFCWGDNSTSQLGADNSAAPDLPVQVSGLTPDVVAISAGGFHTCALSSAGGLKCWGLNHLGQLGNGNRTTTLVPNDVIDLGSGVKAVKAGYYHTCAIMTTGAAKCWGINSSGQLGRGNIDDYALTPTDVVGVDDSIIVSIAPGYLHTCAVTEDGHSLCWGGNSYNQHGHIVTGAAIGYPDYVSGPSGDFVNVEAGNHHSCVLTSSESVKCWGDNRQSQLGLGSKGGN